MNTWSSLNNIKKDFQRWSLNSQCNIVNALIKCNRIKLMRPTSALSCSYFAYRTMLCYSKWEHLSLAWTCSFSKQQSFVMTCYCWQTMSGLQHETSTYTTIEREQD